MGNETGRSFWLSPEKLAALKIALIYAVIGGLWILLSDRLVYAVVGDRRLATDISIFKGWIYVLVTALILYGLVGSYIARITRSEAEATEAKRLFYKGTVYSLTDGKLDLCTKSEINSDLTPNIEILNLSSPEELENLREQVEQLAKQVKLPDDQTHLFVTAVKEAAANAIKHAAGGIARIGIKDGMVQACIQDAGHGIDTLTLPKATLMSRYSTIRSMGLGYSLMLAAASQVHLATGQEGTWVLLEKKPNEREGDINIEELPDTW